MKRMRFMAAVLIAIAAAAIVYVIINSADRQAETMVSGASFVYSKQYDIEMDSSSQTAFPPKFGELDYRVRGINDTEIRMKNGSAAPGCFDPCQRSVHENVSLKASSV